MANKKIEFSAKNVKPFSSWLKRFSLIDNSLLLEIDTSNSIFVAKTYNEERSVVKFSKIGFDEAGLLAKDSVSRLNRRIKVGLYNIQKLIKVMDQFGSDEFNLSFNYDEILGDNPEYAGVSIQMNNKKLKMNIECTSLNIFKYITDDLYMDAISAINPVLETFDLLSDDMDKISSLSSLDNDYTYLTFKVDGMVYVSGNTFELELQSGETASHRGKNSIDVFKSQFGMIDVEDYKVTMGEDRLVFKSTDGFTVTTVSMVKKE